MKSTCRPHAMLSRSIIKRAKHYAPSWFNCLIVCPFWAKSGKYYSKEFETCEINAVTKRKDGKLALVFYLHGQGKAATASDLSESTVTMHCTNMVKFADY